MGDISLILQGEDDEFMDMPPGFRFHPTDQEIVVNYLEEKAINRQFTSRAIGEVDLNSCEPWDLPSKAKNTGEKEWYFFWQRDRKYPTGSRTNRATESGYWKATGKDKEIYKGKGCLVGMKKTLVFYLGRAPRGQKTGWVMHEYRLEGRSLLNLSRNDWVVCRVFRKNEQLILKSPQDEVGIWQSSSFLPPLVDSCSNIGDISAQYSRTRNSHQFPPDQSTELLKLPGSNFDMDCFQFHHECKVELFPDVEIAGGNSSLEDDRGSPPCSVGPLGDLDNMWDY